MSSSDRRLAITWSESFKEGAEDDTILFGLWAKGDLPPCLSWLKERVFKGEGEVGLVDESDGGVMTAAFRWVGEVSAEVDVGALAAFPVVELDLLPLLLVLRAAVVALDFFFFLVTFASSLDFWVAVFPSCSSVWFAALGKGDAAAAFGLGGRAKGIGFSNRSLSGAVSGSFKVSKARRALLATSSFSLVSYRFQSQILISL